MYLYYVSYYSFYSQAINKQCTQIYYRNHSINRDMIALILRVIKFQQSVTRLLFVRKQCMTRASCAFTHMRTDTFYTNSIYLSTSATNSIPRSAYTVQE